LHPVIQADRTADLWQHPYGAQTLLLTMILA
jgi:hypothetical protein